MNRVAPDPRPHEHNRNQHSPVGSELANEGKIQELIHLGRAFTLKTQQYPSNKAVSWAFRP
jgi:hypothetical protein